LAAELERDLPINYYAVSFSELEKIRVESCPFSNQPAFGRSRWDQGLTATEMKRCHWVKPAMVCQIKFTEWTRDDRLRQPVFLGIREDKQASSHSALEALCQERQFFI